jgi:Holliday junction resolvase
MARIKSYAKGSRAERELAHFLNHKDFAVLRVPSSGGFLSPLDVVAARKGLLMAFEIKSHAKKPKLRGEQLKQFSSWCQKAGAMGFVAWRRTESDDAEPLSASRRWMFLRIEDARQNRYDDENWMERDMLLRAMGVE